MQLTLDNERPIIVVSGQEKAVKIRHCPATVSVEE